MVRKQKPKAICPDAFFARIELALLDLGIKAGDMASLDVRVLDAIADYASDLDVADVRSSRFYPKPSRLANRVLLR